MNTDKEIRDLFAKHNVALDRDDVWSVQSSKVVKHKALERLAAALSIQWKAPQVLRAERDEAVILVTGEVQHDQIAICEWSIGEALINANYRVSGKQAPYVYAMAEKRAKDRVILKLAGLHGVYSEDEADDFKQQQASEPTTTERRLAPAKPAPVSNVADTFIGALRMAQTLDDLTEWLGKMKPELEKLAEADKQAIRDAYSAHRTQLAEAEFKDAAE